MENHPSPQPSEGCLAVAVRIPVRIVVFVIVVPVRVVWDLLAVGVKALGRRVFAPVWRGLVVIPFGWLYRAVLTPVGHVVCWVGRGIGAGIGALARGVGWVLATLVALPLVWLYRTVLTPLGRGTAWALKGIGLGLAWGIKGIAAALSWVLRAVFVWPWVALWRWVLAPLLRHGLLEPGAWLYRHVLTPVGHGLARLASLAAAGLALTGRGLAAVGALLLVVPALWLYRTVLTPLGRAVRVVVRETGAAFAHAWRAAGFVSRAAGRALKWLAWNLLGRPVRWVYVTLLTPVGHWVRDAVLRPVARVALAAGRAASETARSAGRATREALASARRTVRTARQDAWRALVGGPPREPAAHRARTLGSTTTASGAVPAPEISLSEAEG
ncbi:hypothetical protein ABZ734_14065 [Streptomyces sp. NPDC006660]|uniref:hypothetical protein n=1 Tax=Streptomyces sp. NPDC006660 TaxID=3156901 RepID=UPI00340E415B